MIDSLTRFWHSLSWTKILLAGLSLALVLTALIFFRDPLIDRLTGIWHDLSWNTILVGLGLFVASLVISFGALALVMVKIPPHYFCADHDRDFLPNSPWVVKWGAVIAKNIAGVILILIGLALSLPGVPGQGILTILLGLIFLDIPGKRPFEARIIKRPSVLAAINGLRAKYDKPPLVLD